MLLGTLRAVYSGFPFYVIDVSWENEVRSAGQAVSVPNGLRVVEAILREKFDASDIAVCHTDELELFVGEDTRVVGMHAHNPLGIAFATDVYTHLYGQYIEPLTAAEFKDDHPPALKKTRTTQNIVGCPARGSWRKNMRTSGISTA